MPNVVRQPASAAELAPRTDAWLSVPEAARVLGRHRTRVYELVRSGDLVAEQTHGGLRVERSSLERWLVAGGTPGGPLSAPNAWAVIGLASGDVSLCQRTLGLLARAEDASRARARSASQTLLELAPRLRRRATLRVQHVPPDVLTTLDRDASLARTGASAAAPYGWHELAADMPWALDAYIQPDTLRRLETTLDRTQRVPATRPVLLRIVDGPWPFPAHCQLAPQPLAALDLLDYPHPAARRRAHDVLRGLASLEPATVARRTAKARALLGPLVGKALGAGVDRSPRAVFDGDPRTDTQAAAAHIVGVLWVRASQGATVKELRAAIGMTRERFEAAYAYLLEHPPLGLLVQRQHDELQLVSAPEVTPSVERDLGHPRPVP
ncbi:MAG: helix-turn-helix domain-containing protein, partial [Chloroflexi bacterium]|nr:helix-turn-helix domain-containing protein [Chloroflexota bacterium]